MGNLNEVKKHFSQLGIMFLLGTILIYAVQLVVSELVTRLKPEWLENMNGALTVSMVPMYLIGMPLLILLVKRVPAVTIEKHSMKVWQYLLSIVMCFCVMYGSNFIGVFITFLISLAKGSAVTNQLMDITTNTSLWINLLYMVICAPIMEELIFRKLIVDRTVRYGQGVAVVLSGLMFGLFHGNLSQFVYAFAMGMFLAFLYVKTGKLAYTIGLHMILNFFGGIISVWLLKAMNYNAYMEAANAGASMEELMQIMMASLPGWIAYLLYFVLIMSMVIAGVVLFIVFRKRFALAQGEIQIPRGKRFTTVILNVGMLVYCFYWIAEIIAQLFDLSIVGMVRDLFLK
uniref:CPBP family intramembrane glutamic endopeptidase n=1 Tax=Acetatifactor sp. TaxID=1872090 RepID=UPI004056DFDF